KTKIVATFQYKAQRAWPIKKVTLKIDDQPVFTVDSPAVQDPLKLYDGFAAPGKHTLAVRVECGATGEDRVGYGAEGTFVVDVAEQVRLGARAEQIVAQLVVLAVERVEIDVGLRRRRLRRRHRRRWRCGRRGRRRRGALGRRRAVSGRRPLGRGRLRLRRRRTRRRCRRPVMSRRMRALLRRGRRRRREPEDQQHERSSHHNLVGKNTLTPSVSEKSLTYCRTLRICCL
ncbi:MAG: hypothetical protein LC659_02935, partial [Myxococcales bacterium]|nr:hypothetical protein [Myxococcales bacterium]